MSDISGSGTIITLKASVTYPTGIVLFEGADDADPIDSPAIEIAGSAMTVNGKQLTWAKAVSIPLTLNVAPGGIDDFNLAKLLENNRQSLGKFRFKDVISMVIVFPNLTTTTLSGGAIISGPAMDSVSSDGRKKTKAYTFTFQGKAGINVPGI